jgi:hypothetical protein
MAPKKRNDGTGTSKSTKKKAKKADQKRKDPPKQPTDPGKKKAKTTGTSLELPANIGGNKALLKHLYDGIKDKCWHHWKFFPLNEAHVQLFTKYAFQGAELWGTPDWINLKDRQVLTKWLVHNTNELAKQFNQTRQYVVGNLKKTVWAHLDVTNGNPPTKEEILGCAMRDPAVIKLDTPEGYAIYDFYYNKLLAKGCANAQVWPKNVRHYKTIQEATWEHDANQHRITPGDEAFVVVTYECYLGAWTEQLAIKRQYPGKGMTHHKTLKDDEGNDVTDHLVRKDKVCLVDSKYSGIWTNNDGGSDQVAGWAKEGIDRYATVKEDIKKARAKKASLLFEKKYLGKKRATEGITETSAAATQLKKKLGSEKESLSALWLPDNLDGFTSAEEEEDGEGTEEGGSDLDE